MITKITKALFFPLGFSEFIYMHEKCVCLCLDSWSMEYPGVAAFTDVKKLAFDKKCWCACLSVDLVLFGVLSQCDGLLKYCLLAVTNNSGGFSFPKLWMRMIV